MPDLEELQEGAEGVDIGGIFKEPDGTAIALDAATEITLRFRKPDGTVEDKLLSTGDVVQDAGTAGRAYYTTDAGFLTPNGRWELQGWATTPDGVYPSDRVAFKVMKNIPAP